MKMMYGINIWIWILSTQSVNLKKVYYDDDFILKVPTGQKQYVRQIFECNVFHAIDIVLRRMMMVY